MPGLVPEYYVDKCPSSSISDEAGEEGSRVDLTDAPCD